MARLSTHVLDVARGKPAEGVVVELHILRAGSRQHVTTAATNADGRTSEPLVSGNRIETGSYELTFHAGDFFRAQGLALSEPPFFDQVVIRFGVADPGGHYHVPLLLSPYSYSTYRGS
jgi:5-hydroxyisourate hydrolase